MLYVYDLSQGFAAQVSQALLGKHVSWSTVPIIAACLGMSANKSCTLVFLAISRAQDQLQEAFLEGSCASCAACRHLAHSDQLQKAFLKGFCATCAARRNLAHSCGGQGYGVLLRRRRAGSSGGEHPIRPPCGGCGPGVRSHNAACPLTQHTEALGRFLTPAHAAQGDACAAGGAGGVPGRAAPRVHTGSLQPFLEQLQQLFQRAVRLPDRPRDTGALR